LNRSFELAVIVGGIIGVGVLRTPGEIATVVQSPWVFVGLWLIGGLFVLRGTDDLTKEHSYIASEA
jgi:APA family basic amino acid/polyamine antiporter